MSRRSTRALPTRRATFVAHWYAGAANLLRHYTRASGRGAWTRACSRSPPTAQRLGRRTISRPSARRGALGQHMPAFHERFDLLLTPTVPIAAFAAGVELPDPTRQERWIDWAPFSYPFNLTQQPAASVPCGLTAAGLPVGLQIVGPMHADALVLRAARAFEAARPWAMPGAPRGSAGEATPCRRDLSRRPAAGPDLRARPPQVERDEIVDFASACDPQPFHLDEAAAPPRSMAG